MIRSELIYGVLTIREHEIGAGVQIWQVIDRENCIGFAPLWIAMENMKQGIMCPKNWELA